MGKCSVIPLFSSKRSQKAPRKTKNYFFELRGYENPVGENRIFELFPIEKRACDQTRLLATILDFDE